MDLIKSLEDAAGAGNVLVQEPMSTHTSFRAGGPADIFVKPSSAGQAAAVIRACREAGAELFVLGNGTNMLVSDRGFRGVVMDMSGLDSCAEVPAEASDVHAGGGAPETGAKAAAGGRDDADTGDGDLHVIRAGAGLPLARLARFALEKGLGGLPFAAGIPGTVGGACVMNAGAYGGEIKDVLLSVTVLDANGCMLTISAEDLDLGYRHSCIPEKGWTVVSADLGLKPADREAVRAEMEDLAGRRRDRQPLEYPSAGSTFKRPEGHFAGKLIQDAGLAGKRVGGASVSEKHCGFVINDRGGTASDIYELIRLVQAEVLRSQGVELTMEVRLLGDFD